jgi:hypothetical protein
MRFYVPKATVVGLCSMLVLLDRLSMICEPRFHMPRRGPSNPRALITWPSRPRVISLCGSSRGLKRDNGSNRILCLAVEK